MKNMCIKLLSTFFFIIILIISVQAQFGVLTLVEPESFEDLYPLDPTQEYTIILAYDNLITEGVDIVDESTLDLTVLVNDVRNDQAIIIVDGPKVVPPNLIELTFRPLTNSVVLNICIDDNTIATIGSKAVFRTEELVVPVRFASFNGKQINDQVELDWQTELEVNNDMFYIQRAYSDAGYINVGQIEGSGNDNGFNTYNFIDQAPNSGVNLYRLQQVDFNGKSTYSESIAIDFKSDVQVRITPNPISGGIVSTMFINSPSSGDANIVVLGATGQIISEKKVHVQEGENSVNISTDLWNTSGIYLIQFRKDDMNQSMKVYFNK